MEQLNLHMQKKEKNPDSLQKSYIPHKLTQNGSLTPMNPPKSYKVPRQQQKETAVILSMV
jgi:hypothetical protein